MPHRFTVTQDGTQSFWYVFDNVEGVKCPLQYDTEKEAKEASAYKNLESMTIQEFLDRVSAKG